MKDFVADLEQLREVIVAAGWTEPTLNDLAQVTIARRLTQIEEHLRLSARCMDYLTDNLHQVGERP